METMTQKIDLNNLDKSTWETFTFEKIAQKISKTVKPDEVEVDVYIGLEHIDADDIHIRRKGVPADVKGGKLRCYPGDIIFGKRRAYQRKAAIVTFDGICSAHAFVFRANEDIIDPKLFPFFLHSDQFMHRMVDISVGGLSPTINWGDLKQQEFLLPPKDQQAKLAELLWAMDDVVESELTNFISIELLEKSYRNNEINNLKATQDKLDNLLLPMSKIKVGKIEKTDYKNSGLYPIVDQSQQFIIGYTDDESLIYDGELPVIVFGDHTTILKYVDFQFVMGADGTKVIKPNSDLDVFYLYQALKELNIIPQGYRRHFSILKNKLIKIPTETDWIIQFRYKMTGIIDSKNIIKSKIKSSKALQKSLINQIF